MGKTILRFVLAVSLLAYFVADVNAQERPKLRPLSGKKAEHASNGMSPLEKKDKWGYVDAEGKFLIRPVFDKVMPMSAKQVGFVSYVNAAGSSVWTPIDYRGSYLTDLEFDEVVSDFNQQGLAVVKKGAKLGLINHKGDMVAECKYKTYLCREQVHLFQEQLKSSWIVIAEDASTSGYTTYTFRVSEPIIVETATGYGIISPRDRSVVAEFKYDSVTEFAPNSIYCLQKGTQKCLYADDKVSALYDDVIPGAGNSYFVVKRNGYYGLLTSKNEILLSCSQKEVPVLKHDEYTLYYEGSTPVYVKVSKRITASEYDGYLYAKYKDTPADYLLEETLSLDQKKYVNEALMNAYGTPEFDRLVDFPLASQYAGSRKFILLSNDLQSAKYLDVETGDLRDADDLVYHAFPSTEGVPAYASVCRSAKFGIIDIRNRNTVVPFEYDEIAPVGNGYVVMSKPRYTDSDATDYYLYHVASANMVTPEPCSEICFGLPSEELMLVRQQSKERIYNIAKHSWVLPEDHDLVKIVPLSVKDASSLGFAAFMKNDAKGALFSLTTGERLTDYICDDIHDQLIQDKYHVITIGKTQGIYDFITKQYIMPVVSDRIIPESFLKYAGNSYVITSRDGKYGLYNVTRKKAILQTKYDDLVVKGGLVRLLQGNTYQVYSLSNNKVASIDATIQHVELLENNYVILFTTTGSGIYDIQRMRWHFSFGSRTMDDFNVDDFNDLGGNLLFIPSYGILNYVTCNWEVRSNLGWANWATSVGDYVEFTGGFEGESQAVYSMKRSKIIMSYGGTYKMQVVTDDKFLKHDYILFHSYGKSAGGGWDSAYGEYRSPSWLPWNDEFGGAGLYNVESGSWLFTNESDLLYLGQGLLYVGGKGLYDLSLDAWTLSSKSSYDQMMEDDDLYIYEYDSDSDFRRLYWFEIETRSLVPISETFSIEDYKQLRKVESVGRYCPRPIGNHWKLYDTQQKKYIPYECDRISLMYDSKPVGE